MLLKYHTCAKHSTTETSLQQYDSNTQWAYTEGWSLLAGRVFAELNSDVKYESRTCEWYQSLYLTFEWNK